MTIWDRILALLPTMLQTRSRAQNGSGITTEYYPLRVGAEWMYRCNNFIQPVFNQVVKVMGRRELEYTSTNERGEEIKRKVTGFVLRTKSQGVENNDTVAVLPDGVYRFELFDKTVTPPFRFLSLPPHDDMTWSAKAEAKDAELLGFFKVTHEDAQVPGGAFSTIKVVMTDSPDERQRSMVAFWYAPNVGLVKRHHKIDDEDILMVELERFTPAK